MRTRRIPRPPRRSRSRRTRGASPRRMRCAGRRTTTPATPRSRAAADEGRALSPRASATAHELSRVGLLAELPGETLFAHGDEADRFFVVVSGVVALSQPGLGNRVLRPGDTFGEVSLALRIPRAGTARTLTPATIVWCDRETFDEYLRPLFADDG